MAWIYLLLSGICEICWAIGVKRCENIQLGIPLLVVIVSTVMSMTLLWLATKTLPLSVAYAAWCGIGIIGVFISGVIIFDEDFSMLTAIFVGLILVGVVGLKLKSAS
jgi:quaternary ammonium compound-resistance protein SugE